MAKKKKTSKSKVRTSKSRPATSPSKDPEAAMAAEYAHLDMGGSPVAGRERLTQLQDTLGRRFGKNTALVLRVAPHARIMRLPFGILMLDWKTRGGLVLGRVNRLWGKKSTLKSTLCLRALRSAQNTCRHCKTQIVRHPDCRCREIAAYSNCVERLERVIAAQGGMPEYGTELAIEQARLEKRRDHMIQRYGQKALEGECQHRRKVLTGRTALPCADCACPTPRWWLDDDDDYKFLPAQASLELFYGRLPAGVSWRKVKGLGTDAAPEVPVLACEKSVVLAPMPRCEPMRCVYVDSEGTITDTWAEDNGVDLDLVLVIGNRWGEECLETVEEATLLQEFDFIVIDSTSVLEPKSELEKSIRDKAKVAAKASLMSRWISRHLANMFDEGLMGRYRPTILCTSQVTTHGIGSKFTYLGPTDCQRFDHALTLDIKMSEMGYVFDDADEHAIRGKFEFQVKKDKAAGSIGATGMINFWVKEVPGHPVGDSDDLTTVMSHARSLGKGFIEEGTGKRLLVVKSKYLPDGEAAFRRVGDCRAYLEGNTTVYDDLRARVLRQLMSTGAALKVGSGGSKNGEAVEDGEAKKK